MEILLLGHPKSQVTRKAKRYFSERRLSFHDRDLRKRSPSAGELRRWVDRFGVDGVLDVDSKSYRESGLQYLGGDQDAWIERLIEDPLLIRLPLVRHGSLLAVGDDEEAWHAIAESARESS